MEADRSGFRATNQKQFLDEYYKELKLLAPTIGSLKILLADDHEFENEEILLEQKTRLLISFWEKNGDNAAGYSKETIATLASDEKTQMDAISFLTSGLQDKATTLLNKRRDEHNHLVNDITISTIIDSILSEIIIIVLIFIIVSEFKSRRKIQDQLHSTVEQLKSKTEILEKSETELKGAMHDLETINKELEKFSYTVAHDIKSPLAGIIGALSIVQSNEAVIENSELKNFADLCSNTAVHLLDMVDFLLKYSTSKTTIPIIEQVNTKELIGQLAAMQFPGKNEEIIIAENMPVLSTRKLKIMQVFQNLLSNAIKYNDKKNGVVEVGYLDKGNYYEFYVRDNGQGIAQEYRGEIFSLSRTTTNKSTKDTSTGFGLNIAKLIVEEQGGKIWYDSVVGQGSTFYFEWKK